MNNCGFRFETTYTSLPKQFFTEHSTDYVISPDIVLVNNTLAKSMGLDFSGLTKNEQAQLFSGNQLPIGSSPFSQAYAGHQFGYFTMLGDGRAHVWGEHLTPSGKRLDIQFKGSGRTPYSRSADGKAALGPMLREYIISEAMYHLGIPTTRSLAVVTTGEPVIRETILQGAILTRVASSHIRVGTFEYAANQLDHDAVLSLMQYTINRHYPELIDSKNKALDLIQAVLEKQAELIVDWMRVGFIHGVMNTDNMTLSGETIDYGPCAFMDSYDPNTVFSSIDHMGRYAYANQANIAQWNLARFAETLLKIIDDDIDKAIKLAEETINHFSEVYQTKWVLMMCSKLGLSSSRKGDEKLIFDLLNWMQKNKVDYTTTFCSLSKQEKPKGKIFQEQQFKDWYQSWQNRLRKNNNSLESSINLMRSVNPSVIPRNHIVEKVLEAANEGNLKPLQDFLSVLREPYSSRDCIKKYQTPSKSSDSVYKTFCGT